MRGDAILTVQSHESRADSPGLGGDAAWNARDGHGSVPCLADHAHLVPEAMTWCVARSLGAGNCKARGKYDKDVSEKPRHLPDDIVEVVEGTAVGIIPQLFPQTVGGKHMVCLMRRLKV